MLDKLQSSFKQLSSLGQDCSFEEVSCFGQDSSFGQDYRDFDKFYWDHCVVPVSAVMLM